MTLASAPQRLQERAHEWDVVVHDTLQTPSSLIAFGQRGQLPVVLKLILAEGDEWQSGRVVHAFGGNGMVRVYEYSEGAVLLERLSPGTRLVDLALNGRDDDETEIIADVIQRMSDADAAVDRFATVQDWGVGFERYVASGDTTVPADLLEQAQQVFSRLCDTQQKPRLLHGDLHHYNVLRDATRGWVAIDPKGVIGEVEYEIGAVLRNPVERPVQFVSTRTIERRLALFESILGLDTRRVLLWAFAQAVLSAIWSIEDGAAVENSDSVLLLARSIQVML